MHRTKLPPLPTTTHRKRAIESERERERPPPSKGVGYHCPESFPRHSERASESGSLCSYVTMRLRSKTLPLFGILVQKPMEERECCSLYLALVRAMLLWPGNIGYGRRQTRRVRGRGRETETLAWALWGIDVSGGGNGCKRQCL